MFRLNRRLKPSGSPACQTFVLLFAFLLLFSASCRLKDSPVYLTPPGLRSVKDPAIVIPAVDQYANHPPKMPVYRDASGNLADGWTMTYVNTRRFSSDKSAWIYCRISDLALSKTMISSKGSLSFRIWPVNTTMVLESYQGDATPRKKARLFEIVVMKKINDTQRDLATSFYPAKWSYARFTPQRELSITPEKVAECHQCHSIAFQLTGDLVFSQFQ